MKLYKLNQGSTFDNLKHFMYITNEYGKPSSEFIDSFIENFGKTILINNFPISEKDKNSNLLANVYRTLDNLWKEIEQDCKDNQTMCTCNYGSLFYHVLESKAVGKLKEIVGEQEWNSETEDNKLLYLKAFIEDFDKYIEEGIDMQEVYLENTPELIKIDSNNEEYIDIKCKWATGRLYRKHVVINKGSLVREFKPSISAADARRINNERAIAGLVDNITQKDMTFKSPSGAGQFIYGATLNGWDFWTNNAGHQIDIYRYKQNIKETDATEQSAQLVEKKTVTTKKLTRDEQAAQVRAKLSASVHDVVTPVQVQQVALKSYIPDFVIQYIKENVHEPMKVWSIVKVTGYNNESQYFYWNCITGELKYIPKSEHSALSAEEQNRVKAALNKYYSNGTIKSVIKKKKRFDTNGAETTVNTAVNFMEVDRKELLEQVEAQESQSEKVEISQPVIRRYRLKEEYNSTKGDDSLIGCEIDFNNGIESTVASDTEVNVGNTTVDIGEYIDKNNIDIDLITVAGYWFTNVYE